MNDDVREKIILQSKCGIRKGMFDFSKEYIPTFRTSPSHFLQYPEAMIVIHNT